MIIIIMEDDPIPFGLTNKALNILDGRDDVMAGAAGEKESRIDNAGSNEGSMS